MCRALCWAPWRNTKGLGDPALPWQHSEATTDCGLILLWGLTETFRPLSGEGPHCRLSPDPPFRQGSCNEPGVCGDLSGGGVVAAPQIKGSRTEASRPSCCQGNSESGRGLSSGFLESVFSCWSLLLFSPGVVGTSRCRFAISSALTTSRWVPWNGCF